MQETMIYLVLTLETAFLVMNPLLLRFINGWTGRHDGGQNLLWNVVHISEFFHFPLYFFTENRGR